MRTRNLRAYAHEISNGCLGHFIVGVAAAALFGIGAHHLGVPRLAIFALVVVVVFVVMVLIPRPNKSIPKDTQKGDAQSSSINQPPKCTFCQKSREHVAKLIASPGHDTYICDECTVLPDRLALVAGQSKTRSSSKLRMFFTRIDCSFCQNRVKPSRLYQSARDVESQSRICRDCLSVCRQILADDARESFLRTEPSSPD